MPPLSTSLTFEADDERERTASSCVALLLRPPDFFPLSFFRCRNQVDDATLRPLIDALAPGNFKDRETAPPRWRPPAIRVAVPVLQPCSTAISMSSKPQRPGGLRRNLPARPRLIDPVTGATGEIGKADVAKGQGQQRPAPRPAHHHRQDDADERRSARPPQRRRRACCATPIPTISNCSTAALAAETDPRSRRPWSRREPPSCSSPTRRSREARGHRGSIGIAAAATPSRCSRPSLAGARTS
jgi:hypothetical protein